MVSGSRSLNWTAPQRRTVEYHGGAAEAGSWAPRTFGASAAPAAAQITVIASRRVRSVICGNPAHTIDGTGTVAQSGAPVSKSIARGAGGGL